MHTCASLATGLDGGMACCTVLACHEICALFVELYPGMLQDSVIGGRVSFSILN